MDQYSLTARATTGTYRVSLPRFVLLATVIFLLVGLGALLAWQTTGRVECLHTFFRGPAAMFLVLLAAFEFSLARLVVRQFSEGEPLRRAWFLIMLSGGCHFVGAACVQVLSVNSPLNPLSYGVYAASTGNASNIYRFGLLVGGPLQMVLLAAGLGCMLRLSHRSGFAARFQRRDWILIAIAAADACFEIAQAHPIQTPYDVLMASNGPLLILLLIEANLVRSSMSSLGGGMIARCWTSFAAAIFLTTLGNMGLWMNAHGYLPLPLAAVSWFIWFLAAAAYALGPAWQIEAIQSACGEVGVSRFSPMARSLSALRLIHIAPLP